MLLPALCHMSLELLFVAFRALQLQPVQDPIMMILLTGLFVLVVLGIYLLHGSASFVAFLMVARLMYLGIVQEALPLLRDVFLFFKVRWARTLSMMVLMWVGIIGLVVATVIVMGLGMGALFVFGASVGLLAAHHNPGLIVGILVVLWIVLLGVGFFVLMMLNAWLVGFPVLAFATAEIPTEAVPPANKLPIGYALRLLRKHWLRTLGFGALLVFFTYSLSFVFNWPVFVWLAFEFVHLSASLRHTGALPPHVSIVASFWANLANMVLWPYIIAIVTLFWYDCQVRSEGRDLRFYLTERLSSVS